MGPGSPTYVTPTLSLVLSLAKSPVSMEQQGYNGIKLKNHGSSPVFDFPSEEKTKEQRSCLQAGGHTSDGREDTVGKITGRT